MACISISATSVVQTFYTQVSLKDPFSWIVSPGLLCSIFTYYAFEHCSKKLPVMLNIMPITTAIMSQCIYNVIARLAQLGSSVLFFDFTCCARIKCSYFDLLCTILCSWEKLWLILYQVVASLLYYRRFHKHCYKICLLC